MYWCSLSTSIINELTWKRARDYMWSKDKGNGMCMRCWGHRTTLLKFFTDLVISIVCSLKC